MGISFSFLADHPDALPTVARWYFDQWGHLVDGETFERSAERLQEYLNRDRMPFVLLATSGRELVGAAQLKFREMAAMFPDREHWLGGVYVAAGCRDRGYGSQLANEIAARAAMHGVRRLYLQTERLDGGLYAENGWQPLEQVNNHGLEVLVMERRLA